MAYKPMQDDKKAIYALVDPRDSVIRYVGATHDPPYRLQSHVVEAARVVAQARRAGEGLDTSTTYGWIGDLSKKGLTPELRLLANPTSDWKAQEIRYQFKYKDTLLNQIPDGKVVDVRPAVARALKAMREARGLTRDQVARTIHKKESTIYRWENAVRTPDINDLAALSAVYNVEPSEFFPSKAVIQSALDAVHREEQKDANTDKRSSKDSSPDSDGDGK